MNKYKFSSHNPAATFGLGKRIGECISVGSIIAMTGELGCGKTLMTRGICDGLNIPLRQVNSPTFVLVNEYHGRLPVYHLDLYRLEETGDSIEIGLLDYLAKARTGVMIVEWAEKIYSLLTGDYLKIQFEILSPRKREITFTAFGDRYNSLIKELKPQ